MDFPPAWKEGGDMKRRLGLLCLAAGLFLLLSGCFVRTVDELYQLPAAPDDFQNLQAKIEEIKAQGAENISPLSGARIQNVQLEDLDGDGVQEAIAFFRVTSSDQPQIYIFRQTGEGYEVAAVINGVGTSIYSVDYQNMDNSPTKEVVVSWQLSTGIHSLAVYSVEGDQVEQLVSTDYTSFQVVDLDRDNVNELLVFKTTEKPKESSGEKTEQAEGGGLVEYYDAGPGILELQSTAPMSAGIEGIVDGGIKEGLLKDSIPAVFVQSKLMNDDPTILTTYYIIDIFAVRDGVLTNITLNEETGESGETIRIYSSAGCTDINSDSITEVPQPAPVAEYKTSGPPNFWFIEWRQYALDGTATTVFTTYHNDRDGWYLILPDDWVGRITLSRSDLTGGGERAVIFSYWDPASGAEPQKFLTIYRLTGNNRVMWAGLPGRFRLDDDPGADGDVIYAAEFRTAADGGWDCGLDEAGLKENFRLIRTEWSVGF